MAASTDGLNEQRSIRNILIVFYNQRLMAEKQIKQWGVIGGLESKSKSWTTPRAGILDMMYRREESYTETTYTDFGSVIAEIAEHYQADFGSDYVIYHELT